MASLKLRDRDAIITSEGLIFRVFGCSHPQRAFICDAEYASANIFKSNDSRAPRNGGKKLFYKFYNDEGWKLIFQKFPQYTIFHEMLSKIVVGVNTSCIKEYKKPEERLQILMATTSKDELHAALQHVLHVALQSSSLSAKNFGVFGSMFHGFYHRKFSDIDLIVYGRNNTAKMREALEALYANSLSSLRNEFETDDSVKGKLWRFKNYSAKEFLWHQNRKLIYGLFDDCKSRRTIKTEFEPVKEWEEIIPEYNSKARILQKGWVKINACIVKDDDASFIPSVYGIEPLKVLNGTSDAIEATRIISYMEEFRLQAQRDEKVYVEGNLEKVIFPEGSFYQIALTYCPHYYDQVLKVTSTNS